MKKYFFIFLLFFFTKATAQVITTIAGVAGAYGYSGDGGPATSAKLKFADAVAVDDDGSIYISEQNDVVRKVNTAGIISTFAGNGLIGFSGDGGPATAAKFKRPQSIAFDKKGNVYIADGSQRIRKVNILGIISTYAGTGATTFSGDGGPATAAGLNGTGGGGFCIDGIGNLYVCTFGRIRKIDTFGIITTFAGTGISGFSGDGGPASAAQIEAYGIAIDNYGNIYFVDGSSRVRKIATTGIITTVAGYGTEGFSGDGGPATTAQMKSVGSIFPDKCGNIYIADFTNHRIRKVDGHGIITTFAGNGFGTGIIGGGGHAGDGGPATAAELNGPQVVYLDKNGSIYIADQENHCVRYVHMDSCHSVLAIASLKRPQNACVTVFPNPNSGTFKLGVASAVNEVVTVTITNMIGAKVKEFMIATNKEGELNVSVPAGLYLLSVQTSEQRYVQRIVVE